MEQTKLSLSAQQLALVTDPEIILTKNAVLEKIQAALYTLNNWQQEHIKKINGQPAVLFETNGKVSKGENYKGLPYMILDYPRNFTREHVLSIRTMFWWGRQVSTTLHLSGNWKQRFAPRLCEQLDVLQEHDFYLSASGDEWEHNLQGDNYHPLAGITAGRLQEVAKECRFLKIASFMPVSQLTKAPEFWRRTFCMLTEPLFKS